MIVLRPDPHESSAFRLMENMAVVGFISIRKERRATRADWGLIWSSGPGRGAANDLSSAWQAASRNWERWKDWALGLEPAESALECRRNSTAACDLVYRSEKVGSIVLAAGEAKWTLGDPIIGMAGDAVSMAAARLEAIEAWREFWSRAGLFPRGSQ